MITVEIIRNSSLPAYKTSESFQRLIMCTDVVQLAFPDLPPRLTLCLTKHKSKNKPHWAQLKYNPADARLHAVSYAKSFAPYFSRLTYVPAYSRLIELVQSNPSLPFFSLILPSSTH